ncbi:unnamed protein product [Ambrosiozyma monospora]|uniref:Unnamed protein product n=1 Tax=Ambrosiozyma monospora TaxID=43982 RepID=A0ACB5TCC6_AMBMO|nr:unnamed protein product [Ambrosiozyma monospora]
MPGTVSTSPSSDDFETVYNVELSCNGCVNSVKESITKLDGITKVEGDVSKQTITVLGSAAPSSIVSQIQATGRDAIIRGTGKPNSAAVCILESFDENDKSLPVKGLARLVAMGESNVLVDLTLSGVQKGKYYPSFRESGNIWKGALTTGNSIYDLPPIEAKEKEANSELYKCQEFVKVPLKITDLIGRSLVVSNDPVKVFLHSMCGVIARSAGAWENDKHVCSCTGKTVWQERKDAVGKGIN